MIVLVLFLMVMVMVMFIVIIPRMPLPHALPWILPLITTPCIMRLHITHKFRHPPFIPTSPSRDNAPMLLRALAPLPRPVLDTKRAPRIRENLLIHGKFSDEALVVEEGDEFGKQCYEFGEGVGACGGKGFFDFGDFLEARVGGGDVRGGGGAEAAGAGETPFGF